MDRIQQNRSNAAIVKQGRTFSFIKQLLNKIIQFLSCHVLVLSFGRILNHIEHFIEEDAVIILCRWTLHVCKMAAVIYLVLVGEVLM